MNNFYKKQLVLIIIFSLILLSILPLYNAFVRKENDYFNIDFLEFRLNNFLYKYNLNLNDEVIQSPNFLFLKKTVKNDLFKKHNNKKEVNKEKLLKEIDILKKVDDKLSSRGIKLLIAIAPNKISAYYDEIPKHIDIREKNATTEVLKKLLDKSNIKNVYLRDVIIKNKKNDTPLYYKFDTHWNNLGAYYGYKEIINSLNKAYGLNIKDIKVKEIKKITAVINGLDLLRKIRLEDNSKEIGYVISYDGKGEKIKKTEYDLLFNKTSESITSKGFVLTPLKKIIRVTNNNALNNRRVLYLRDSFATINATYFQTTFKEVWHIANDMNYEAIMYYVEKIRPDIVIFERIERSFG